MQRIFKVFIILVFSIMGIRCAYSQVITVQDQADILNEQISDYNNSISLEQGKIDADNSAMQDSLSKIDELNRRIEVAQYSLNEELSVLSGGN